MKYFLFFRAFSSSAGTKVSGRMLLLAILMMCLGHSMAQVPTVANLTATGTDIKWYLAPTGGTALDPSTPLVNGQHYYASQTVNGCESTTRLDVVATVVTQAAPATATHTPSQTQVIWNWNTASGATGYKWNTVNTYGSATDMGTATTKTETGLTCGVAYTRYVWAYNALGCVSSATTLSQTTSSCVAAPTVVTSAANAVGSTSATLNGNITSINGATVTIRGFKYSTTSGFDPVNSGTNLSESGSYSAGTYGLSATGLPANTDYYFVAYATNSAGTTYGSQQTFKTQIQTDFAYTGGVQTFVVPAGVTTVTLQAWGAQGGDGQGGIAGALGGYSIGTLSVTSGETLILYVGGKGGNGASYTGTGVSAPGGWNGGGTGGYDGTYFVYTGGGGGGKSDVRTSGGTVLITAGGGGGSAAGSSGGVGGGTSGTAAIDYNGAIGGGGGSQIAGGSAYSGRGATPGSFGQGGNGSTNQNAYGSAGGGGGYYGGGGGSSVNNHGNGWSAGGGGGSSYIGGVTGGSTTAGLRSGHGRILISY